MQKKRVKQMQKLKWKDKEYRENLIISVLGSEKGQELLEMLKWRYDNKTPDMTNPNKVYFELGKKAVINDLQFIIEKEN